jgi:hypothetical protein
MGPSQMKCPYCGEEFDVGESGDSGDQLTPRHDFPRPCRSVCPGSGKPMRRIEDPWPLGKDEE